MTLFFRAVQFPVLTGAIGSIFILLTANANANAIPVGDAYETVRPSFKVPQHFNLEMKFPLYFIRLYTQG